MATTERYDLYSHAFRLTTHEAYARMREESPVHLQPGLDGETPIGFVTRYDDVVTLLTDDERFVVDPKLALTHTELEAHVAKIAADERASENLLATGGEDHRRLRRLVTKAFTPRIVEQLRPRIQQIAEDLIEVVEERGGGQTLRRGELVIAVVGSANRDGAQFTGADALDLARADRSYGERRSVSFAELTVSPGSGPPPIT